MNESDDGPIDLSEIAAEAPKRSVEGELEAIGDHPDDGPVDEPDAELFPPIVGPHPW